MEKRLIVIGLLLCIAGISWPWFSKLGRLPGDIIIEQENFSLYIPITTAILLSLFLRLLSRFL